MVLIDLNLGVKLVFILGIVNILSILLVFFSCRCLVGVKFVNKLWQYGWSKRFYSMHCYYWWVFITSVFLHTILAFLIFGNPL